MILLEVDMVTYNRPLVPASAIEDKIGLLSFCAPSQGSK